MSNKMHSILPALMFSCLGSAVSAADLLPSDPVAPRVVAQVIFGTAGFEPGVAAEWRVSDRRLLIRPEASINEDGHLGFGASLGWNLAFLDLPERHTISIGPRVVYHNTDEYKWGADAMAIWSFDFIDTPRHRHYLEVIGTIGFIEDDEHDETDAGASAGIGYGFQF
jgi:hypothetical protein